VTTRPPSTRALREREHEAAGDEHSPVAAAIGDAARDDSDRDHNQRSRHDRETGLEKRVAPPLGKEEDRFPNGQEARLPISQLYVRWANPIEDPTDYLADRVTDTPFFFDGRSRIVRYLSEQRAAFGGLTALASSAIQLAPAPRSDRSPSAR
jgi:hypothetical protein